MTALRNINLALLLLYTASCSSLQLQYASNEENPYYMPPAGSELILQQAIIIPPQEAAVFLQNGNIVAKTIINRYRPNCKFEVSKLSDDPQVINPDTFVIQQVSQRDYSLHMPGQVLKIAQRHVIGGGVQPPTDFTTIYNLQSAKQPNVLRLSCQIWLEPKDRRYLTLKEIRRTLGNIMTIKLTPAATSS